MISTVKPVCWGCDRRWLEWPIANLPEGATRVKRRVRVGRVASAFVKVGGEVTEYYLAPFFGRLVLSFPVGANRTEKM